MQVRECYLLSLNKDAAQKPAREKEFTQENYQKDTDIPVACHGDINVAASLLNYRDTATESFEVYLQGSGRKHKDFVKGVSAYRHVSQCLQTCVTVPTGCWPPKD